MSLPTAVSTFTSQTRHVPYLTNEQFKLAPTPVAWNTLVPEGTPQECEVALTQLILRASAWVDSICQQVLAATIDTEQRQVSVNRWGQIILHPRYQPVTQLVDLWTGTTPVNLIEAQSLSGCAVEPKRIIIAALGGINTTSMQGPIQFGGWAAPGGYPTYVRYSYINGYPVTTIAPGTTAAAGTQQITVVNPVGIIPSFTPLTIRDGYSEPIAVTAVNGSVLSLASPLANTHLPGAAVTALPDDVEEAVILACTGLAKTRGNMALIAASTQPGTASVGKDPYGSAIDLAMASEMLTRGDYLAVAS